MIFNIDPIPKPRMTKGDKANYRPVTVRYWTYKAKLQSMANMAKFTITNHHKYSFIIPMPISWTKKKRLEMDGKPHQSTPDLDNLLKGLWDALLVEDSHIWSIQSATKMWGIKGKIEID